eukprot:Protomagalhaensia_sp_Gyna_25__1256@NODE_1628_length_1677_cov_160_553724_g1331_i0_p1_GENE_NODE_1628_length_1677_cov_160_553724_g1331_i0NODE_1628_length_1677_cov_160_553724_g1331_i0_p1_ORF_typecomplete_len511_score81_21Foiegras_1/PF11817_8/0_32_NODE_1628_length_1677_cov_160_553724_g1331_i0971629
MSDSEFEFEDDEYDTYYDDNDTQTQTTNQKLAIENAYYDAEDRINRDPEQAAQALHQLRNTILGHLQSGSSQLSESSLRSWHVKVLRSLLKIPHEDFQSKSSEFRDLLGALDLDSPSECTNCILTGLEVLDHSIKKDGSVKTNPDDLTLYLELLNLVCDLAMKLGNQRLWQSAGLRSTRLLLDNGKLDLVEDWLAMLYAEWMNLETKGHAPVRRPWDTPEFFEHIAAASAEELAHAFEIIALDFEYSDRTGVDWRLRRLIRYCDNFSRVMVNRRTLSTLKRSIAKYYFERGAFDAAYPSLFDAWEANFSLGNIELAQRQLADLVICNVMCGSQIDPLSTREAHTLQSQSNQPAKFASADGSAEYSLLEIIKALDGVKGAFTAADVKKLIEAFDDPRVQAFLATSDFTRDVAVKRHLVHKARQRKFLELISLWIAVDLEFLQSQLQIGDLGDLKHFIIGMSGSIPSDVLLGLQGTILRVMRHSDTDCERSALLDSLNTICNNLNMANLYAC